MGIERVVVVGGGLAGLRIVEGLRSRRYAGAVTLVGAEAHPPYDRPPLSKQLLAGGIDDTRLDADFATLGVGLRLGERAVRLTDGVLLTDRGEHKFDRLVVATGAVPVGLPGDGPQRFLRTIDDARALRDLLRPGLRLAVVGAGWIGAELATAAEADEVVTAVGVRPAVAWLEGSGLKLDNGVAVDDGLRSSLPGVLAVGDCAAFWSRRYRRRLRVEHWDNALHAPDVAAANLLGGEAVYDPVPYFWSEQFGRMLQYIGHHGAADRLIWRGDPAQRSWSACWLLDGRLTALLAVDRPRDLSQGRRVASSGARVDPARLADPEVPLRAAMAT